MNAVKTASRRFDPDTGGLAYTGGGNMGELARKSANSSDHYYTVFIGFSGLTRMGADEVTENSGRRSRWFKSSHPDQ